MTDGDRMTRKGDWLQTSTGKQFWPLDPRPEDLDIRDIAHSLAMQCRFTGHTKEFYSVAEHSLFVSYHSKGHELTGLLHDASEAYLTDVAKPVKPYLGGYAEAEDRLMRCVAERYGITWPLPSVVKEADFRMLATEKRDLMGPEPASWGPLPEPYPLVKLKQKHIWAQSWQHAERSFLARFEELTK